MSPLGLIQERVSTDLHYPWRVVVCCALLNQTSGQQVRPMIGELFARVPSPHELERAYIIDLLKPLGFRHRRLVTLMRMTSDYLGGFEAADCYGVGRYGRDALALFCDGRIDLQPDDTWLLPYLKWRLNDPDSNKPPSWDRERHAAWRRSEAPTGAVR